MHKHDTVVPPSRPFAVLPSVTSTRVSGKRWYVNDSSHLATVTLGMLFFVSHARDNSEQARLLKTVKALYRIAKSAKGQTVGSNLVC